MFIRTFLFLFLLSGLIACGSKSSDSSSTSSSNLPQKVSTDVND